MTLARKKERNLEKIKSCLSNALFDKHSNAPQWETPCPSKVTPAILPNNLQAVEATFRKTEARLAKEPFCRAAYGDQIHCSGGAAIKFTREQMAGVDLCGI